MLVDSPEPEPDIVLAAPEDIYLVIEVANTSMRYDREVKGKMYARDEIIQYVLLNLKKREAEIFSEPLAKGYKSKH